MRHLRRALPLIAAGLTLAGGAVAFADAAPMEIDGAPSAAVAARVERRLTKLTAAERDQIARVVFADAADGRLRWGDPDWTIVPDPTIPEGTGTCAQTWDAPEHRAIIIRDRPDCLILLEPLIDHEAAHMLSGDPSHGPVWLAVWSDLLSRPTPD